MSQVTGGLFDEVMEHPTQRARSCRYGNVVKDMQCDDGVASSALGGVRRDDLFK
ncbi:MAG: hypothetical protein JWL79_3704 [Frankiales bacterium]|nr:hypothetical protein [Frankiales bacterium]